MLYQYANAVAHLMAGHSAPVALLIAGAAIHWPLFAAYAAARIAGFIIDTRGN